MRPVPGRKGTTGTTGSLTGSMPHLDPVRQPYGQQPVAQPMAPPQPVAQGPAPRPMLPPQGQPVAQPMAPPQPNPVNPAQVAQNNPMMPHRRANAAMNNPGIAEQAIRNRFGPAPEQDRRAAIASALMRRR